MYLQERLEELDSAILDFTKDKNKVNVTGFLFPERLIEYYEKGIQCFFSQGLYDHKDIKIQHVKDNGLFYILKPDDVIEKYQFLVIKKDVVKHKFRDENGTLRYVSRIFKIRKCKFTELYNYIDSETNLLFNSLEELSTFFEKKYDTELCLE
ncbi:hypothetical protein [Clostridium cadaveris]|uniref:hypothetical protein n=1 Tax=Clostridium cadaveris TaxID=1529 RepID=UPI000C084A6E|nr:hypothetical protein [Clostridium cadaveris]